MSVKEQITDGLSNMNARWKLSCFSIAESVPEGQSFEPRQKNEVVGDVSFEEVRWADYQEPNKQVCIQRFAEANHLKRAQFQVGLSGPHIASCNQTCCTINTSFKTKCSYSVLIYVHVDIIPKLLSYYFECLCEARVKCVCNAASQVDTKLTRRRHQACL